MRKRVLLADGDCGLLSIRGLRLRIDGYEVMEFVDCAASVRLVDRAPRTLLQQHQ